MGRGKGEGGREGEGEGEVVLLQTDGIVWEVMILFLMCVLYILGFELLIF